MGQKVNAEVTFNSGFEGELKLKEGSISIGMKPHQASPYALLQGALVSCFHSTFLDVIVKKKIAVEQVVYAVEGEKRDEIPSTLKKLHLHITVYKATNQTAVLKAFDLAAKYCSVYTTISQVAQITTEIVFVD